jgi:hypothetical protein
MGALASVAVTLIGTSVLIFDVVVGLQAGIIAGVVTAALTTLAWLALPRMTGRRQA